MKRGSKIALYTVSAIVVAASGIWLWQNSSTENSGYTLPELNEEGTDVWSDADRYLPTDTFEINPLKDTALFTSNGSAYMIPAGSFECNSGKPVTIEIKEALTAEQIIQAGLSTTSNGNLLETGGTFYFNARQDEKSLAF
ncbi:MAG: hypothetical protein MUC87_06065 [Bacteroidia bacterium]|jgi:hypothetical protein|nr:hypothetical protein [Bacteroidia bacterium]